MNFSIFTLVFLAIIVISFVADLVEGYIYQLVFGIFGVLFLLFKLLKASNYIYYTDKDKKIVLRYAALNPFYSENNSIEINQSSFVKYELREVKFPKKVYLKLFVKTADGIASYPEISLSSLTSEEFNELILSLKKFEK